MLDINFWFSTDRIAHAIQAAPAHLLTLASVSLTTGHFCNPSLENFRNLYQAAYSKHKAIGLTRICIHNN
jgi:hypothetical protein